MLKLEPENWARTPKVKPGFKKPNPKPVYQQQHGMGGCGLRVVWSFKIHHLGGTVTFTLETDPLVSVRCTSPQTPVSLTVLH